MATLEESRLVQSMVTLPRNRHETQQQEDGAESIALQSSDPGGLVDNMKHLLPLISVSDSDNYSTSKRVRHLNDLAKVIKYVGHVVEPYYPVERIIECARLALTSVVKEIRAGALRVLRYVLTSKDIFSVMLKHRVDVLVARSLDVSSAREIERIQAMRFVRQAVTVSSQQIPRSLIAPLVSILLHESEPPENLTWSSMATLSELALLNPEVAAQTWAIKAILKGLLKCSHTRISESVVLTLSHLLNTPSTRRYVRSQLDIESLLAPITDLHYRHLVEDLDRSFMREDIKLRIEASKMAIVALLKSWPGVYCLCSPSNNGLGSLLEMLPLSKPEVQREILDLFYSVFQLKVPEWTDSFTDAVISIDPSQPKSEWSLIEGFVVEEGNDLLPPKNMDRTNLVECYHALLLATLMEEGLFEYLVETVLRAERHVTVMATILLAQLLHMTNTILPPGYFSDAHVLPELIAAAMAFGDQQDERIRASEVISCLDRVHQMKKQDVKPSSLYLKLILEQSGYFSRMSKSTADKDMKQHMPPELDEATLNGLIKDTGVLLTKEYATWNWNLLRSMLQHPGLRNSHIQEDTIFAKFIKRLCNFYKPSNHLYSVIVYSEEHSRKYSSIGKLLVKYLCRAEENPTGYLYELLQDIVVELSQVTASKLTADVFSASSVAHKLARDYFLFIGTVSFYKPDLLAQCKIYAPLLVICNYHNRSDLMKLMISCLDFAHDVKSRVILSKILTAADSKMRLYATKHMRVLLRSKMPFFNSWGLEMLIYQLYDLDKQIGLEAVDILDEACQEESFLEAVVLQQPHLTHLGEKGASLLTRFFSVKRGYSLMSRLGYIDRAINMWFKEVNSLYVYLVEERLALALTSFKQTEEGEFIRRNNTALIHPKAFIPIHLFGQLVQHEDGCARVEQEQHVVNIAKSLRLDLSTSCSAKDVHEVKAAVWALGHIGSTVGGLDLLLKEGVVSDLVVMAESCPVLSIRGTCFYALCLISKTIQGANVLLELGWTSVQHSPEEKWPLNFDQCLDVDESAFASPSADSPTRKFTFAPFIGTSFDPYSPGSGPGSVPASSHSPLSAGSKYLYETLPGKVAGSKSFAENLHSSSPASISPLVKDPNQSPQRHNMRSSLRLTRRGLDKSDSSHSLMNMSGTNRVRRSISRKGSSNKFFKSVKERSERSHRQHSLAMKHSQSVSTQGPSVHQRFSVSSMVSSPEVKAQSSSSFSHGPMRRSISRGLSTSSTSGSYLGICLPMDIEAMFEYEEPDYEGCPTKMISAPDFDKDVLPHDPTQCMECAIPLIKAHRVGASLSIESINDSLARSRSHTSDSISSSTSSTPITKVESQSGSDSRTGTEPSSVSRSPKSPADAPKFSVGSIKSGEVVQNGSVDSTAAEKESKSRDQINNGEVHLEMNGTSGSRSPSCSPLVRMKRIYDSGGSNSGNEEEQRQTETAAAKAKITENDETDAAESDGLHVAADLEGEGHSPSSAGGGEGENESGASSSRPEELLSPENLSGQIESPSLNEDSMGGGSTSSSSEAVSTPKSTADRLSVKKDDGGKVSSSSSGSIGDRVGVAPGVGGANGGSSSTQSSSETKDVTSEVLINVLPSSTVSTHAKPSRSADTAETTSISSTATTQSTTPTMLMDESSPEGRRKLHHAVLDLVYGLSSDVSVKKNSTGLHMICQKFPSVCQDVCLYSKVMELLSTYQYSVPSRRFIQSKFDKMTFSLLFAAKPPLDEDFSEDDLLSSACSSRRGSVTSMDYLQASATSLTVHTSDRGGEREATSKAFRRRSSTSDALRFREKLQELSRSADMHDDMMGESPREVELAEQQQQEWEDPASPTATTGQDEGNDDNATVTTTGAANSNSNNNSPVERVSLTKESSRPANLFNVRFRSHVRASSDTTVISTYTKTAATSKLTEVHATVKDTAVPAAPSRETGMEPEPEKSHGDGMELGPAISVHVEGGGTSSMDPESNSVEECPIPTPRVELLPVPGGVHARAAGADTDKLSLEVSTESNVSIDSDRKSAIVDIGYDL